MTNLIIPSLCIAIGALLGELVRALREEARASRADTDARLAAIAARPPLSHAYLDVEVTEALPIPPTGPARPAHRHRVNAATPARDRAAVYAATQAQPTIASHR